MSAAALTLAALAGLPIWVAWKQETRNGRLTKTPFDPRTGRLAASNDARTWATHDEAQNWAAMNGGAGVGFMFSQIGDAIIGGIDLDTCRNPNTEAIEPWAQAVIDRFATYAEVSPSGKGVKLYYAFACANLAAVEALFGGQTGRAFKNGAGVDHPPAIEIYCARRYFAVTRDALDGPEEIRLVDVADLRWLILEAGPTFTGNRKANAGNGQDASRSAQAFRAAVALRASGLSYEADARRSVSARRRRYCLMGGTKGSATGERELHRTFDRAGSDQRRCSWRTSSHSCRAHDYVYMPGGDFWPAARVDARLPPFRCSIRAASRFSTTRATKRTDPRQRLARQTRAGRANDLGARTAAARPGQADRRRRLDRAEGRDRASISTGRRRSAWRRRESRPWLEHVRRSILRKPSTSSSGSPIGRSGRMRRSTTRSSSAVFGIGKDTLLEPVKHAVGAWNFKEVSPQQMLGRFNGFLKSVVLRVSEAKDMGEFDRFKFYDHMKAYMAAPPDVLRVDEKNLREHGVLNVCGVIITTNHKIDGIYLPADDRRHYVAWSDRRRTTSTTPTGAIFGAGMSARATAMSPPIWPNSISRASTRKRRRPRRDAFWAIVDANRAPEDAELADVLDAVDRDAVTLDMLINKATGEIEEWLRDRKNRRAIPHPLEQCGYVPVRNVGRDDGLFIVSGRRQVIYAPSRLPIGERIRAARALTR